MDTSEVDHEDHTEGCVTKSQIHRRNRNQAKDTGEDARTTKSTSTLISFCTWMMMMEPPPTHSDFRSFRVLRCTPSIPLKTGSDAADDTGRSGMGCQSISQTRDTSGEFCRHGQGNGRHCAAKRQESRFHRTFRTSQDRRQRQRKASRPQTRRRAKGRPCHQSAPFAAKMRSTQFLEDDGSCPGARSPREADRHKHPSREKKSVPG